MKTLPYLLAAFVLCVAQDLGHVENFRQKSNDVDYITLAWDFVDGDGSYDLYKYTLVTDDDFSEDIRCPVPHCEHDVEYLDPCTEYNFTLTPVFKSAAAAKSVEGDRVSIIGHTADKPPGSPSSLQVVTDTESELVLSWQKPTVNPGCVQRYEVCFRLVGETSSSCETTTDATISASPLEACGEFHVTVTPYTPSDSAGNSLEETILTRDGVPGEPMDVTVGIITEGTIDIKWNDPAINPLCAADYSIVYGETHTRALRNDDFDNHATLNPLASCTNYTIDISAVNLSGDEGPAVTSYAATEETEPVGLPVVSLDPSGTDSIDVSWGANEDDSCAGHFEICWLDGQHPIEVCENVTTGGDGNFTITDLLPCTHYDVVVTVVSPGGLTSTPTANSTSTGDVAPGPVVDLRVTNIDVEQLTISYEPPRSHPQCVKEYDIEVIDQDQERAEALRRATPRMDDTITGLEPCTDYLVRVRAVSPAGKRAPWQEVSDRTLEATPSEPRVFGMSDVSSTSVSLQWFQPEANPRCASAYLLHYEGDGANETLAIDAGADFKVEYTVTGLAPCVEYAFSVRAQSSTGESAPALLTQSTRCS